MFARAVQAITRAFVSYGFTKHGPMHAYFSKHVLSNVYIRMNTRQTSRLHAPSCTEFTIYC